MTPRLAVVRPHLRTPEYYPTRIELAILRTHARAIAAEMGPGAEIIEFGAGSCVKVALLLDAMERPARYLPIDISGEHLAAAAAQLRDRYPGLDDDTVVVDRNHYFREAALNREYITFSNHKTSCPRKGQASHYSLMVDGELNADTAWFCADPKPEAEMIKGRVAFWKGVMVEA